jgi:hypothetical protein
MSDGIMLTIGDDGEATLYDDTYDITIHCESKEEQDEVRKALENIPHWIPVTEDTPTEDDDYWCTFDAETGRFVDWCGWYKGQWVVWIDGSPNPVSNVIAWCKPMKPYKGVTGGND